jgi:hypothetical protein
VVSFSGLELRGHTPFSLGPARNLAEAAALGHASEVLRLLSAGEDPNRVSLVRKEVISSVITKVTPLEAGIWSRRAQLVELFDRQGAIVGDEARHHLACLATDIGVEEIVEYLSPHATPECEHGQALNAVLERSKEE